MYYSSTAFWHNVGIQIIPVRMKFSYLFRSQDFALAFNDKADSVDMMVDYNMWLYTWLIIKLMNYVSVLHTS